MKTESIDLIYLDPPFNANANYAAPIGSEAAGAECKDTSTLDDIDITCLDRIEMDHIIATSVGATDHIDNLQLLCGYCNRGKGNRGKQYLIMTLNTDSVDKPKTTNSENK